MQQPGTGSFSRIVEFVDGMQVRWRVSERDCHADPGARGTWCLIFASSDVVRRVWEYPADWHLLSSEALATLSWHR